MKTKKKTNNDMKKIFTLIAFVLLSHLAFTQGTKISALPSATVLTGAEIVPIVQGGVNKKATVSLFTGVIQRATKTVSSVELLTIGSAPVTIISAPGAGLYINIIKVAVSYNYNSVAYDFSSIESPTFTIGVTNATNQIAYNIMNLSNDWNGILGDFGILSTPTTNTALTLTTAIGTDPSVGNGDLDVVVYYTIESVNN